MDERRAAEKVEDARLRHQSTAARPLHHHTTVQYIPDCHCARGRCATSAVVVFWSSVSPALDPSLPVLFTPYKACPRSIERRTRYWLARHTNTAPLTFLSPGTELLLQAEKPLIARNGRSATVGGGSTAALLRGISSQAGEKRHPSNLQSRPLLVFSCHDGPQRRAPSTLCLPGSPL